MRRSFFFSYPREVLLNDKKRDSWRTNARLPCVKGAGTAIAVTEGLYGTKRFFLGFISKRKAENAKNILCLFVFLLFYSTVI